MRQYVAAAVVTSAAVGNERASLAVNLGAGGWWKSKRGRADPNEFVVIVKMLFVCVLL